MSNSRAIDVDNYEVTTREKLLDLMYENRTVHAAYMLKNCESGETIVVCMQNDANYLFIQGYATYFQINPSKLALRLNLADSLGVTSENDVVGYSTLNENRASLVYKCFGRNEETPKNSIKPGF